MSEECTHQFIARYSRWIAGAGVIISLAFVSMGLWLLSIYFGDPYASFSGTGAWTMPVIPFLLIGAFSLLAIHHFSASNDRRPQLVIDSDGIFWRPWMKDVLRWEEIKKIEVVEINMVTHIYVTPHDPNRAASTESAMAVVWSLDWLFGNKRIPIKPLGLDKSSVEIMTEIHKYHPLT